MKTLLKVVAVGFVLAVLLAIVSVWFLFSSLSSGYEVSGGEVFFRSFSNVNWKVERKKVDGADPKSIRTVRRSGGLYASDGKSVFYEGNSITDADPETFKVLDWRECYSADSQKVFYGCFVVSSDPANFQILSRGYSKDLDNVYYGRSVVEGADPKSFVVTGTVTSEAKDKNRKYDMGRPADD